jgi:hypothetical protein
VKGLNGREEERYPRIARSPVDEVHGRSIGTGYRSAWAHRGLGRAGRRAGVSRNVAWDVLAEDVT